MTEKLQPNGKRSSPRLRGEALAGGGQAPGCGRYRREKGMTGRETCGRRSPDVAKKKKEKKLVDMDEKSANPGDRMKHALSLEVLSRIADWPTVTYSETHAGAGVYLESKQKPANAHIRSLRERVLWELLRPNIGITKAESSSAPNSAPGAAYLDLLKRWWLQPDLFGSYPGSAKQAGEYLTGQQRPFRLLLTENHGGNCQRLRAAVKDFPNEVKAESFESPNLEWMTKNDDLYLVVDPFRCVESFTGHPGLADDEFGVTKGDIDHGIVRKILRLCSERTGVVIHFWWPTTSQDGISGVTAIVADSNKKTRSLLRTWESERQGRCYQQFEDNKHNHASALLGQGKGADVVRQIGQLAWERSWLSPFLRHIGGTSEEEVA
jgi:hypothetical protein